MLSCSWLFREMQSNFSKFCLVFWRTIWLLWSHGCTGARDQHLHVGSARTGIVTKLNAVLTQFPLVFHWKEIFGVLGLQVNVSLAQGMGTTKKSVLASKILQPMWNFLKSAHFKFSRSFSDGKIKCFFGFQIFFCTRMLQHTSSACFCLSSGFDRIAKST